MSAALAVVALAGIFAAFGLLRPMDRRPRECHGCTHAGRGECGDRCPALEDLESRLTREHGA